MVIHMFLQDKSILLFSLLVFLSSVFCCIVLSSFVGVLFLGALLTGILLPLIFFSSDRTPVPNLLNLFTGPSKSGPQNGLRRSCSICGGEKCNRQHTGPSSSTTLHAHIHFTVPQSIDEAVEELLNLVLDHHIYSWYKEISVHDQLADEIRFLIRYASCSLGARLCKVDLTNVILHRLIPAVASHLDTYVEGSRTLRGNDSVEASVIHYFKSSNSLHKALISREEEANYLRELIGKAFPYIVPLKYQESSLAKVFLEELLGRFLILEGLDLLADPDTLHLLYLHLFSSNHMLLPPTQSEPDVLFLKAFSSVNTHPRNSVFRNNLSSVLRDQTLLYLFHNYLKEEGAINILSFCLAVEDFNRHILDPDLTSEQLQQLHKEALELYHTYMIRTAVDRLEFQPEIVAQIREIVHSEVSDIVKLRTTRPLFQAYEYAYNLLEREYLPLFMDSNSYFSHLCGSKNSQHHQRSSSNRDLEGITTQQGSHSVSKAVVHQAQRVGIGLANISRQMTLKPSVVIGYEDFYMGYGIDKAADISSLLMAEECITGSVRRSAFEGLTPAFCDLSAWRVCIPRVEQRMDANGQMNFVFIVDVKRIDVSGDNPEELHWEVERQYHEFYILEATLTEFHGEFPDNILPPRRSLFTSKGTSFVHSRRQVFEEFLQKLLQKPSLKGSQLLFLFLKTKDEFTPSYLPDVSLGRLLKEVPRKLIKERGQNLDSFISSFISGTSYANKRKAFYAYEEIVSPEDIPPAALPPEDENLISHMYGDNCRSLAVPKHELANIPSLPAMSISGVYEIVLYVAVRIYGLSLNCVHWALCIKALVGNTVDAAIAWYLRRKLREALVPSQLVKLVHLIRDALFVDPPLHRSELERMIREKEVRREVFHLIPKWIQKVLFTPELYAEGANSLVSLFQHPLLNKQLSYVLLDMVVEELFPELSISSDSSKTVGLLN